MGVMTCSRVNCNNILCDEYIPDIGYICNDCIYEFKQIHSNREDLFSNFMNDLEMFMKIRKGKDVNKIIDVDRFFKEVNI